MNTFKKDQNVWFILTNKEGENLVLPGIVVEWVVGDLGCKIYDKRGDRVLFTLQSYVFSSTKKAKWFLEGKMGRSRRRVWGGQI